MRQVACGSILKKDRGCKREKSSLREWERCTERERERERKGGWERESEGEREGKGRGRERVRRRGGIWV